MKFTIDVECTPEEARSLFGLPDISPVNKLIVDGLAKRTEENLDAMTDPQKFFANTIAGSGANIEAMQQMFMAMMAGAGKSGS